MNTPTLTPSSNAPVAAWTVRGAMLASKIGDERAARFMEEHRAPPAAVRLVRAGVAAGGSTTWAGDLMADHGVLVGSFSDFLRTSSCFYRLLSDGSLSRVPLRTRAAFSTAGATGWIVGESAPTPLSKMTIGATGLLDPVLAAALIVMSDELVRLATASGQALFNRALRGVLASVVDQKFLEIVLSGVSAVGSAGNTATDALADLRGALTAVDCKGSPSLAWVCAPDVAKRGATLPDANGEPVFPTVSPVGGTLLSQPLIVSDQLNDGELVLLRADQVVADADTVELLSSSEADVEMLDDPAQSGGSPPSGSSMVSLFQTNSTGLLVRLFFGAERLRADAVALVNNIAWGSA